ncbi:MAG: NADH-quinone oxidoreductase subunit M [Actinobacteria bacterium]|nr:NADH-quinone oxidoreductase subunit M [Actinomycetota bacterium]
MSTFPWLTALLAFPLMSAAVVMVMPKGNAATVKRAAFGFSLVPVAIIAYLWSQFDANATEQFQFAENTEWIRGWGVHYALGVDGIALAMIALSVILVPVVIIAGWNDVENRGSGNVAEYFAWFLVLETFMVGVFAATDVFLFYVFFEAMLVPVYFLIGRFGGPRGAFAAMKFFIYSLVGGLIMLAALIGLYVISSRNGIGSFAYADLLGLKMDPNTQKLLFLGFFAAFAIKAPLVPVHTWLPDAAQQATPATTVLLVGVLDKVGTFGMLRLCLPLFPEAARWFTPTVLILGLVGIIYGAIVAIGQTDMRRLIAFTSISHFGFITIGVFVMTSLGQSGATLYMVNHGFSTAALLLLVGYLISRRGSARIADFGGVHKVAPVLAGLFLVAGLSSLALPGMSSFVSEFMVLQGTFLQHPVIALIATSGVVLAATYILVMYKRTMTGPVGQGVEVVTELNRREIWAISPLVAALLVFGFFPKPVLDVVNPAIARVMQQIGAVDPQPRVAVVDTKAGQ